MEWTSDVSVGAWIDERLEQGETWSATMHGVVPRGFDAYARVFHRPWRDDRPSTWAAAAAAFGTRLHPEAQWNRIVRAQPGEAWDTRTAPDRSVFRAPLEGALDADLVAAIAGHLARATTTPDSGVVGLWEGWGGLLGFFGETPSRTFFTIGEEEQVPAHHREMLERSIHDPFNNVFRKPTWQAGILPDDVSKGPRLELPGRGHVLFRGGIAELARADWILSVPWRDRAAEEHGFDPDAQSPSIAWPDDRAWVLVTEVDYDSTIVGGSRELVEALVADPALEALEVPGGADLTWEGDRVNT